MFCGTALLACAALDLVWIYMFRGDVDDELRGPMLRAGYYMWVASFAWVGIALILRRPSFR